VEPELPLVEAFLSALHALLGEEPQRGRIVAEVEDHLREATFEAIANGLAVEAAQRQALARFGSVVETAAAFQHLRGIPRVYDARQGLPEPAILELRRATRLSLAIKDSRTAVVGYWVPDDLGAAGERFGAILVRRRDWRRNLEATAGPPPTIFTLERNKWWHEGFLPELHPGMQLQAECWSGQLRLWFGPILGAQAVGQQIHLMFPAHSRRAQ
jgi:hypothetical protein